MKVTTLASSLCATLGLIYFGGIQAPAFLAQLSMADSYLECQKAQMAITPEAMMKDTSAEQRKLQAACVGAEVKSDIAMKVLHPAGN